MFPKVKNPVLRRRLRKTGIALLVLLLLATGTGVFLGYFYEDTVKRLIINELNKRLNTRIVVADIEKDITFSIFKKFPYASVEFHNVKVLDATTKRDNKGNLLEAESVYLQISIWDLIFKDYRIRKVEATNGLISIKIFKDRTDNYHFWKPATDTASSGFSFDLQKVVLSKMGISYLDYGLNQDYRVFTKEILIKGKFSDEEYTLNIDGDLFVNRIKTGRETWVANRNSELDVTLFVSNQKKNVVFSEGSVRVGKMQFDLTGNISYADSITYTDLQLKASRMKFRDFVNELPPSYKSWFSQYDCSGEFYFTAAMKGFAGKGKAPLFQCNFGIRSGELSHSSEDITLRGLSFDASYTNGSEHSLKTSELVVSNLQSALNNGNVSGSFSVRNFSTPEINLKLKASLGIEDVIKFLKPDTVQEAGGQADIDIQASFVLQGGVFTARDFIKSRTSGSLTLRNAGIKFKNGFALSDLNGDFVFSNNDIETGKFSGRLPSGDFNLAGQFRNILPYLFLKEQQLGIVASFRSQSFDLGEILKTNAGVKDSTYRLTLPDNIRFSLDLAIRRFVFGKFTANDISGIVVLKDKQLIARDVKVGAMGGRVEFTGLIDASRPGKLLISCDANLSRVDIRRMFTELDNFGQGSLQDKNIRGLLTARIQFASVWSNTLTVDPSTIFADATLEIDKGELIEYAPLMGLTDYVKGKDFSHVKFETLKNRITISNQIISIPAMEINSNTLDIKVYGSHTFKNEIDYHLSVLISQLRKGNPDKPDNEVGTEVDDGLHKEKYFFRITGTVEKPVYHSVDKEGYRENVKENLSREKENLKTILNREFGWFKKDSTLNKKPDIRKKENYDFNVTWDEEEEEKGKKKEDD